MALSAARATPHYLTEEVSRSYPVKASTTIYQGGLVALNAGYLVPASTATGLIVVGCAQKTVNNSAGSDGDLTCPVLPGTHRWANGDTIAQADVGSVAYASDDLTVTKDGTGKSFAGVIEEVDSAGVWVSTSISYSGVIS